MQGRERMSADVLAPLREALAAHRWQQLFDDTGALVTEDRAEDAQRLDLHADAAWWLGQLDDCIEAREAAYRLFEDLGDYRRAGQSAVWLYEHHAFRVRPAMAGAWLRRARRSLADDPECVEHGALVLREAESAHGGGDLGSAAAQASSVLELARRLRSADLEAEALQTLGRVRIDEGDVEEGVGLLDEAMLLAVEGRLGPYSTGKVYCSMISACEQLGDLKRAAEWTDTTAIWSEQHPFAIFPGICRIHHAVILKHRGSLAEAEAAAAKAGEELVGSHLPNAAAAWAEVGDIRRRLGDFERAEEAFRRAAELCGNRCSGLALLRLAEGRITAATEIIELCVSGCGTNRLGRAGVLPARVQIALAAGDVETARAATHELDATAETLSSNFLRAVARSTRGRLELAEGDPAAVATLRDAVAAWTALDVPYESASARTLLAQALRDAGDEKGSLATFTSAAEQFDQIGARLEARSAIGDASEAQLPAGLTEREAEVLRLVASGMTNSDIAEALFLSAKTVSRHLSNIFTKIDVSSRAAATAFAFEHGVVENPRT